MAIQTTSIAKNSLSFASGATGSAGVGKQIVATITGTPEIGDKFNIQLGNENFGFVGKPSGRITALETLKDKVHAGVGSIWYQSAIAAPTQWDYENNIGAAFNNIANNARGSEDITGMSVYQGNLAIFTRRSTQIWFVDPDPTGNRQMQVLDNIGAIAPRSIVSVGDIDVFFLADSGLRSLRARDSSNAAFVSDIGTPIDPLLIALLRDMTEEEKRAACAVVEPEDGRYWLALGEYLHVFSYFSGAKISAWGRYRPPSPVRWLDAKDGRVYARCEDGTLLLYGGADNKTYDETQVVVVTPFIDARQPGTHKQMSGLDVGIEGEWIVDVCTDLGQPDVYERVLQTDLATYCMDRIPVDGITSHFRLRLTSIGEGYARLANIAVHYDGAEAG